MSNLEYMTQSKMNDFTKVVRLGLLEERNRQGKPILVNVYCEIKWFDGKLSISGVVGPTTNGDCWGSCGQINMGLSALDFNAFAPGWDLATVNRFFEIWDQWHLNDMTAGSPDQEAFLKAYKKAHPDWKYEYTAVCKLLNEHGLLTDPNYQHDGKPYRYGTAWLRTEVPASVIDFLSQLPDTDKIPAWV